MATIKIETTVQRWYDQDESDTVEIDGTEEKQVTLTREIKDVEDLVWAIEEKSYEVIRDLWEEVKDCEELEDFGWYGPYPKGNIEISASYGITWHDAVEYIAERDNIDDPSGIYLDLRSSRRTDDSGINDALFSAFLSYLAEERDVDTSHWVHGRSSGGFHWG